MADKMNFNKYSNEDIEIMKEVAKDFLINIMN